MGFLFEEALCLLMALITGAIFIKFGLAPATSTIFMGLLAKHEFLVLRHYFLNLLFT